VVWCREYEDALGDLVLGEEHLYSSSKFEMLRGMLPRLLQEVCYHSGPL
jgi:hypothetical protein